MINNNGLPISEVSKKTGITTSAINFYVRNKIIPPPLKTSKTRAVFPEDSVDLLKNILRMRKDNIPLKMIKYILNNSHDTDTTTSKNKTQYEQLNKVKNLAAKNVSEYLEYTGLEKFVFEELVDKSIITISRKDPENNILFDYSDICLGKAIEQLIINGIPLEVIERHIEYEPLSKAEALFLLEHLKNSRNYNRENKEEIIKNFEDIRNIMRLEKLKELEQRLI